MNITDIRHAGYIPAVLIGLSLESYLILAGLMVLDVLFGVIRVIAVHGGKHLTSYRFVSGILSKWMIILLPLITVWVGRGVGINLHPLAEATLGLLIISEFYSILGNIYSIRKGKDVPEFDAISALLRMIRNIIEKMIKSDPMLSRQLQAEVRYKATQKDTDKPLEEKGNN